jgi:hypothetical protein
MPDLAPFHPWIVFVHVLGVFLFLIFHGVSVGVLFRIRAERDPQRLRALLDLSLWSMTGMGIGALVWFFSGILAGFSGNFWATGRLWLWVALGVAIVVGGLMTPLARFYVDRVRTAVGIDTKTGKVDPSLPVEAAAIEAAASSGRPMLIAAIGFGGVAILAWLMMFKPF